MTMVLCVVLHVFEARVLVPVVPLRVRVVPVVNALAASLLSSPCTPCFVASIATACMQCRGFRVCVNFGCGAGGSAMHRIASSFMYTACSEQCRERLCMRMQHDHRRRASYVDDEACPGRVEAWATRVAESPQKDAPKSS